MFLDFLFVVLVLLAFALGFVGLHHQLAIFSMWIRERADGGGHWSPFQFFQKGLPEAAKDHRAKATLAVLAFFAVCVLVVVVALMKSL